MADRAGDLVEHGSAPKPGVAVWADYWLPISETFIANQINALRRWSAIPIGFSVLEGGSPVAPMIAPFSRSMPSRVARRMVGVRRHLDAYVGGLRDHRAALVHAHFGPGAMNALPIAERAQLPFVVTFHGYDVTRLARQRGVRGLQYRHGLRRIFQRADRLLAVSGFIRERLLDLGAPDAKIVVSYLGAPTPPSAREAVQRAGIVFVGRLVEKKGVADLLRAVAGLPADLRGTPVEILGTGDQLDGLRALARSLGVDASFRGAATPSEVAAALARAAVFCGPSKTAKDGDTEGLPVTLIEAAHHGATIVATRHAGIPEFIRNGREGLLVAEGDVAALSAALTRVLTDRELADALATRAGARARTEFAASRCTAHLEALYDEVARGWEPMAAR